MLNIVDIVFLFLAIVVNCSYILIDNYEAHMPVFFVKLFRYGSFAYRGSGASYLQLTELPKYHYKHFYKFAAFLACVAWSHMVLVYYFHFEMNTYIYSALKSSIQCDEPSVSATSAFIAMSLMTLQCIRRCYESHYVQVFANTSKINILQYPLVIIHYSGCVAAIVGEAPLFCGNQNRESLTLFNKSDLIKYVPCILLFLWAWNEQFQSNIILANMRKDKKSGKVVTEDHGVPHGRLFEAVSSPHRFCEGLVYTVLLLLIPTRSFFCIYLWVIGNQIETASLAHNWYTKTFKNYPQNRMSIIPGIL